MCASSSSKVEQVAVFVDTNLGTNMVVGVCPNTHVRDFKREFELEHLKCFPDWGEIRILGLMVKQKSSFYLLPESMLIKQAFQGKKGTWFLHMQAKTLNSTDTKGVSEPMAAEVENHTCNRVNGYGKSCSSKLKVVEDGNRNSNGPMFCDSPKLQQFITNNEGNKQDNKEKNQSLKCHLTNNDRATIGLIVNEKLGQFASQNESCDPLVEASSEMSSHIPSVTDIINRYFPSSINGSRDNSPTCSDATIQSRQEDPIKRTITNSYSHVNNNVSCTQSKGNRTPTVTTVTVSSPLLNHQNANSHTGKLLRLDVGKRLVNAGTSVNMAGSKKSFLSSLQGFKDERVRGTKLSSMIRTIGFDISDSE